MEGRAKKLFCPYLLAGFPSMSLFVEILELTSRYADIMEIGIPFSDPVADGPIIRTAAEEVLSAEFRIDSVFRVLHDQKPAVPIAIMSYANPILGYGNAEFFKACKQSNVSYLIVPDVPHEESAVWKGAARESGMQWISFVSLQTRAERLRKIASTAEGFVYLLAVTGITGSRIQAVDQIHAQAKEIRQSTDVPVLLGFGIGSAQDILPFQDSVDGFIIGSRIVDLIRARDLKKLEAFYEEFQDMECRL